MQITQKDIEEGGITRSTKKRLAVIFLLYAATVFIPAAITLHIMKVERRSYKKWKWVPLIIYFFPYMMVASYFLFLFFKDYIFKFKLPVMDLGELANMRYNRKFPLRLYYDPLGNRHKFPVSKASQLINKLKKGDIILRRHENYLDSLILTQASFFTHAGICTGFDCEGIPLIVHAIGKTGVDYVNYYDFMRCDDVAVVRLNNLILDFVESKYDELMVLDKLKVMCQVYGKLLEIGKEEAMLKGRSSVEKALAESPGYEKNADVWAITKANLEEVILAEDLLLENSASPRIGERQSTLYKNLKCKSCHTVDDCIDVATDMFEIYRKRRYDYLFNFTDITTMSCIEFVWYCYKCVYPMLNVEEEKVEWFKGYGLLKVVAGVMLPDSFVTKRNALDLVFTSVEVNGDQLSKQELTQHIKSNLTDFRDFHKLNLSWQAALCLAALVCYFTSSGTRKFTCR